MKQVLTKISAAIWHHKSILQLRITQFIAVMLCNAQGHVYVQPVKLGSNKLIALKRAGLHSLIYCMYLYEEKNKHWSLFGININDYLKQFSTKNKQTRAANKCNIFADLV